MEKIVYIVGDNLKEVNHYLSGGWTVKTIVGLPGGGESYDAAYVVLEKSGK